MPRTIHAQLTPQAREVIRSGDGRANRAGRTLRQWLAHSFDAAISSRGHQGSLFGETISVDDDVPLLLEALARVTEKSPDDLVEAWALEEPGLPRDGEQSGSSVVSAHLPDNLRGKIAELLDLAETLFEETVSDVGQRFGPYPQGKQAGASAAEIYCAIRSLLKIVDEK